MVKFKVFKRFIRQETGVTMIEALLSIPLVMIVIAGMIEVGVMMFKFSQTAKAMQIGARLAVVSTPVVPDMAALTADYPEDSDGDPVPTTPVTVECGAGAVPCDAAALARIYDGGDGNCGTSGSAGDLVGICDVAPFIPADRIHVAYIRSGLGYVGRSRGPVVTVRIEFIDDPNDPSIDMLILDDLIRFFLPGSRFGAFTIPAQTVAMTSEDLSSCRGECP